MTVASRRRSLARGRPAADVLSLEDRRTPELILGFVGPVGSGVSFTAKKFAECLKEIFEYSPKIHKVSEIIRNNASLARENYDENLAGSARISKLQNIGNKLRTQYGPNYLSEKVVEQIATARLESGYKKDAEPYVPLPLRHVHLIDSIKNPHEVNLLRDVYGETFFLIGIFSPEETRVKRLKESGVPEQDIISIIRRDEDEGTDIGQKVRDTIYDADFFIRNDGANDDRLKKSIIRFLNILFNISVDSPTLDEAAMYTSVSAAANSACLSRQVGAAIYSASGELIGVGANDVPKFGGGTYRIEDGEGDHRCYKWGGKICHNDDQKSVIYEKIIEELRRIGAIQEKGDSDNIRSALMRTGIKSIIEFSRAVHAEMEAIISVARGQKSGIVGSTLYSTTFPCHNCARHIVAAGIRKVIYIEPYPKSLANKLHDDSITVHEPEKNNKVLFLQYEGIAPKNIIRFFKTAEPRKNNGRLITRDPKTAVPVYQPPLDGFAIREQIIVRRLAALEGTTGRRSSDI